jgi:hypothetical protein
MMTAMISGGKGLECIQIGLMAGRASVFGRKPRPIRTIRGSRGVPACRRVQRYAVIDGGRLTAGFFKKENTYDVF